MPTALLTRCLIRGDAAIAPFVLTYVPALPYYDMFHESFLLQVEYSLTKDASYGFIWKVSKMLSRFLLLFTASECV